MIEHAYQGPTTGRQCIVHTRTGTCGAPGAAHEGWVPPVVKEGLSTDEVKEAFQYGAIDDASAEDFDAWLHKIQVEARKEALEMAASRVHARFQYGWLTTDEADKVAHWLREQKEQQS